MKTKKNARIIDLLKFKKKVIINKNSSYSDSYGDSYSDSAYSDSYYDTYGDTYRDTYNDEYSDETNFSHFTIESNVKKKNLTYNR